VFEFNKRAIRAYEKCGFVEYGRRRQAHFMSGQLWDVILMECLSSDFQGFVKEWDIHE
jgi:diamine N-acetyltransferase